MGGTCGRVAARCPAAAVPWTPPTEVEAIDIVLAQRFSVRRGAAQVTHERRVVVRNLVNGVTRTVAARQLQPAGAAWQLAGAAAAGR